MNKAFNAIKSTLKMGAKGLKTAVAKAGKANDNVYDYMMSRGYGNNKANRLSSAAGNRAAKETIRGYGTKRKIGMNALGIGGLGAGAAAADFLNPWGLGFGD